MSDCLKRLKANQAVIFQNFLHLYKQSKQESLRTVLSNRLGIASLAVVNCTHVLHIRIGSRIHPESKVDSLSFVRDLIRFIPASLQFQMPFLGHVILLGKFSVNLAPIKGTDLIRMNMQGQETVLLVSHILFLWEWMVSNITGQPYVILGAYHEHVNCVMKCALNPCYIILNTHMVDHPDYQVSHIKKSFPSTYLLVKNPALGFKKVTVFDQGKMNILGVNLVVAYGHLPHFLNYIKQHAHQSNPDIRVRRAFRAYLYESQHQQKREPLLPSQQQRKKKRVVAATEQKHK